MIANQICMQKHSQFLPTKSLIFACSNFLIFCHLKLELVSLCSHTFVPYNQKTKKTSFRTIPQFQGFFKYISCTNILTCPSKKPPLFTWKLKNICLWKIEHVNIEPITRMRNRKSAIMKRHQRHNPSVMIFPFSF